MKYVLVVEHEVAVTRDLGRAERERAERKLAEMTAGDVLEIDLRKVKAMTISFADELIGRLIAGRAGGNQDDRGVVIRGQGEDLRETLDAVLSRRGVGALFLEGRHHAVAVGGPPWFAQTVDEARDLGIFRASQLGERLDLTPQAANGRLKKLSTAGAVVRSRVVPEGGGKEYEYRLATVLS
jgi:hypothetical protein